MAVAALIALGGAGMQAQTVVPDHYIPVGGVGPAIAGSVDTSSLPSKALKLIEKTGQTVVSCEREYASGSFDVKLNGGIEIEFDAKGNVTEIDAPDHCVLGADFIREVVPGHLYDNLGKLKMCDSVSSIEAERDGYEVEFEGIPYEKAVFNHKGDLVALYYKYY